ncbi:MAG: GGDEF domain-containing protein [Solirubrobacterales bacterium]
MNSENGAKTKTESALRAQLAKVDRSREQIAKAWLVDVILNTDLSEVDQTPISWATGELPQLISDILMALSSEEQALDGAVQRAARLADQRGASTSPAQLTREISYLHSSLLATLRMEFAESDPKLFAELAERLAALFTRIGGYTVDALTQRTAAGDPTAVRNSSQVKHRLQQMVALTQRYGSPFALLVLDVEGPGARNGDQAMGVVSHAIRGSIRLMDEAFQTDGDGLWVLAPNQTADSAAQMAHRLNEILTRLERASGLRVTVSTGVVGCPEHGEEADRLLHAADTAMWRARATGRPFLVAGLQDR